METMTVVIRGTPFQAAKEAVKWGIELQGATISGHTTIAVVEASPEDLSDWYATYRHVPFPVGALLFWCYTAEFQFDMQSIFS